MALTPFLSKKSFTSKQLEPSIAGYEKDEEAKLKKYGVSGTNTDRMTEGALLDLLNKPKMSSIITQAQGIADKTLGDYTPSEPDWGVMSLLYFSKMAEEASKPGATALGAAGSAFTTPAAYLMQKQKDEADRKEARETKKASIVTSLIPSLYTASKTGTSATKDYIVQPNQAEIINKTLGTTLNDGDKVTLNQSQFGKLPIGTVTGYEKDTSAGTSNIYKNISGKDIVIGNLTIPAGQSARLDEKQLDQVGPLIGGQLTKVKDTIDKEKASTYLITKDFSEGGIKYKKGEIKLILPSVANKHLEKLQESDAPPTTEEKKKIHLEKVYTPLRENYFKSPEVKGYKELSVQFDKVKSSYKMAYQLKKPQVADLSMIFAYMKMLDPRSVVRESEQDQAQRTGGAADWLITYVDKIRGGGGLTEEQRNSFFKQAQDLLRLQQEKLVDFQRLSHKEAKLFGLPKEHADIYIEPPKELKDIRYMDLSSVLKDGSHNIPDSQKIEAMSTADLMKLVHSGATNVLSNDKFPVPLEVTSE